MQLFVTNYTKNNTHIIVSDTDLLLQLRKVLRANIGDMLWIQSPEHESKKIRFEVRIDRWDNKIVEGSIVSEQMHESIHEKKSMIIAMPNKRDKVELIVQKLTECGLDQIIFWPSERSVLKEWNNKKEERLNKIIKEAVEQSRGRTVPELIFTTAPKTLVGKNSLVIFDKQTGEGNSKKSDHVYGLVGPEGGLTHRDYQTFEGTEYAVLGLGETVLRTETAAIVGGWLIKNGENSTIKDH